MGFSDEGGVLRRYSNISFESAICFTSVLVLSLGCAEEIC